MRVHAMKRFMQLHFSLAKRWCVRLSLELNGHAAARGRPCKDARVSWPPPNATACEPWLSLGAAARVLRPWLPTWLGRGWMRALAVGCLHALVVAARVCWPSLSDVGRVVAAIGDGRTQVSSRLGRVHFHLHYALTCCRWGSRLSTCIRYPSSTWRILSGGGWLVGLRGVNRAPRY
ncbi:hypothetical protein Dimus_004410 [Dionaea muscipula]